MSAKRMILVWIAMATVAGAAEVRIDPDRTLVVDGVRTFVLGLYEDPKEDRELDRVRDAGFNLVQSPPDTKELDRLHARGLHAWINMGGSYDLSQDRPARETGLGNLIKSHMNHPAMLAWEVPDEALWNLWYDAVTWRLHTEPGQQKMLIDELANRELAGWLGTLRRRASGSFARGEFAEGERLADSIWIKLGKEVPNTSTNLSDAAGRASRSAAGVLEGYRIVKQLDSRHPIWMNHAPRNSISQLAAFNRAADAVGCDIYPAPPHSPRSGHSDIADRSLTAVGAYTRRMQAAAPTKPVWMVLQGFGWPDLKEPGAIAEDKELRRPTREETRFMAFDAIVHGARGILYFGTFAISKESELWKSVLAVTRELADLQPFLASPDSTIKPRLKLAETWGSLDRGVHVLAKNVGGEDWFLVVNEEQEPLRYTLEGLSKWNGKLYRETKEGLSAAVDRGKLEFPIRGEGVHVLRPDGR